MSRNFPLLQKLANLLCQQLNIRYELCFVAISELQNTALDNLKSIDEFNETGEILYFLHFLKRVIENIFIFRHCHVESPNSKQSQWHKTSQFQNKID